MILNVVHRTQYEYAGLASESHNEVRLQPLNDDHQRCLAFRLSVRPDTRLRSYTETGGPVHYFNLRLPHAGLEITAEARVRTNLRDPFAALQYGEDDSAYYRNGAVPEDYAEYLGTTRLVTLPPEAAQIARTVRRSCGPSTAEFLEWLNKTLGSLLQYEAGVTSADTRVEEVLAHGRGVCQDFSHLMLAVCRSQGIPSRYVSGYLYTGPPEDTDAAKAAHVWNATHAWVECLLPDGSWHGFDPTNALLADERYVKIHVGRDYADVVPVRGVYRGPETTAMRVQVRVEQDEERVIAG